MEKAKSVLLCLGCGAAGGILGYIGFFWLIDQNFYGLVLPGGLLGLGAGMFKSHARWLPFVSAPAAAILGLITEWRWAPFVADPSLGYFVSHLHQLKPITLIMVGVGAVIAFWVPFRRG